MGVQESYISQQRATSRVLHNRFPVVVTALQSSSVAQDENRAFGASQRDVHSPYIWMWLGHQVSCSKRPANTIPARKPTLSTPGPARTQDRRMTSFSCP